MLRDGEPCTHPGCLSHVSHPCEGCGRIGGHYLFDFENGIGKTTIPCFDGVLFDAPTEEHTWPTYGGISRSASPEAANWKMNEGDPTVLTLEKLTAIMDALPKFQKLPPYYRVHPETYIRARVLLGAVEEVPVASWIGGVRIEQDTSVPPGEFLPPEGWEP